MLIGNSKNINIVRETLARVAQSDASVYLTGETGSGKEVAARYIHDQSKRCQNPFIAINCGALSPNMTEAEIFGYEKGAFTGAVSAYPGRFEQANQGTLLLDEVGEMTLDNQVTLLRVLENKEVERIGGRTKRKINVRIICATNRSPEEEVIRGNFREDLYYRLNVFPIKIPPLRERTEDIEILIQQFLKTIDESQRPIFTKSTINCFKEYHWPGNVRELRNVIERALVLAPGEVVSPNDLGLILLSKNCHHTYSDGSKTDLANNDAEILKANSNQQTRTLRGKSDIAKALDEIHFIMKKDDACKNTELNSEKASNSNINGSPEDMITPNTNNYQDTFLYVSQIVCQLIKSEKFDLRSNIQFMEKMFVREALSMSSGSVSAAARILGLRRTTLIEKIKRIEQAS